MTGSDIAMVLCAALAAFSAIMVAVIEKRASRERKATERRAERRERESRLSMDMMYASCSLAMDTAAALRDGHTNGTLEGNLQKARDANEAYENFIRDEAAHAVAKV